MQLKPIHNEAIASALEKAVRYRVLNEPLEAEDFGSCGNFRECEAVCPKSISIDWIAKMNRDYLRAKLRRVRKMKLAG